MQRSTDSSSSGRSSCSRGPNAHLAAIGALVATEVAAATPKP